MRRGFGTIALVVICADARPLLAQQDYLALVERYARCDDRAPYDLREQPRARWSVPPGLVGPAIVLHAHAAEVTSEAQEAQWHLDRAVALFGAASAGQAAPHAPRDLMLKLLVLQAGYYQVTGEALKLRDHMQQLPSDLPRATRFLLRGEAEEFYDSPLVSVQVRRKLGSPSPSRSTRDWLWQERVRRRTGAADLYRQALAADPALAEAAVRLGRLMLEDGKLEEAEEHLRRGARPDAPAVVRYWAELLLGRLLERKLDLAGAEVAYRRAVGLQPSAQSARLALAQVLWRGGRAEEASQAVDILIANSALQGSVRDPWWDYVFGSYWRRRELLAEMQQLVRPCR